MVTPEMMAELKMRRPFQPFRLVMKNGEQFDVLHDLDFLPSRPHISLPAGDRIDGVPERGVIRRYEDIDRVEPMIRSDRSAA